MLWVQSNIIIFVWNVLRVNALLLILVRPCLINLREVNMLRDYRTLGGDHMLRDYRTFTVEGDWWTLRTLLHLWRFSSRAWSLLDGQVRQILISMVFHNLEDATVSWTLHFVVLGCHLVPYLGFTLQLLNYPLSEGMESFCICWTDLAWLDNFLHSSLNPFDIGPSESCIQPLLLGRIRLLCPSLLIRHLSVLSINDNYILELLYYNLNN